MFSKLMQQIDRLIDQINPLTSKRKEVIKMHEGDLLSHVENDIIAFLEANGFFIVEHQYHEWVTARRNCDCFCVWMPKNKNSDLGSFTFRFIFNDTKGAFSALVSHHFSNCEYNYLSIDYHRKLVKQIDELKRQKAQLEMLGTSDINGAYLIYRFDEKSGNGSCLKTLGECFTEILREGSGE